MKLSLKRAAGWLALVYTVSALVALAIGWVLQQSFAKPDPVALSEVVRVLQEKGPGPDLDHLLGTIARSSGHAAMFVTQVPSSGSHLDGMPVVSASQWRLLDSTWPSLDAKYALSKRYVRARWPQFIPRPGQATYAVWVLQDYGTMPGTLTVQIALVTAVAGWLALATWLFQDARDRGLRTAPAWLVLALLTGPAALAVWQIARPERAPLPAAPVCPGCGRDTIDGLSFCVRCGQPLRPVCGACRQPVQLDWEYCGSCGADLVREEVSV